MDRESVHHCCAGGVVIFDQAWFDPPKLSDGSYSKFEAPEVWVSYAVVREVNNY